MTVDRWEAQLCTCIALCKHHPHKACDEPPTTRGGICHTCRYQTQANVPPPKGLTKND